MSAIRKKSIAKIENQYVQQREKAGIAESRKRKLLFRRLAVFALFASVISYLMISTYISQSAALEKKQSEKEQLEQKLASLQKQQEILDEEIVKLNDDEYIAKLARKEYFLSEKNEIIFNLPKEKKDSQDSPY
ncbi:MULTISPECIES: septum formation initiator family protein [unclassified Bacillus (in: firmicutes)]|jgi:cell division protein DivIC|uniref:FtsB family cell division protein n=1 Tax=unclassified Bacillus (in: firmicutes) TaxID=185979 RepID=UPI001BE7935B|nr:MULTISPECIES: septum formation initiator family protein [unclassified Bacillus (in: firmicutes)]MBT2637448.1 septum formation initiator family protein [Bacillus sp. ISL-39]MBT2644280.1 septum formation initiator family protein [Bacillus sp. ISL-41]MBT2662950.1 septum formation initiator family protein [Bacillus sp. ISL-45]